MLHQSEREVIGIQRELDSPFNQNKATSRMNNLCKFDEARFNKSLPENDL